MRQEPGDTIAAISTPPGEGGIAVVRISGPDALEVSGKVFTACGKGTPSEHKTHTVRYGHARHPVTGETLDEVLLTVMRAPKTYTKEDVVEINCHGGNVSVRKVLEACITSGARLAEPGEFTKRAFINGRIDLAQAEAVMDLISSETSKAQRLALGQLAGGLSAKVEEIRLAVVDILALLELSLDFSQEDVDIPPLSEVALRVEKVLEDMEALSATAQGGMIIRSGASVVICGKPNVGKSSLMNALLRHDRVIVAPVAGTTRDVVEESINLGGAKVHISDTAGITDTRDRVEMEGIRRSREKLAAADLVIFMMDASCGVTEKDSAIYEAVKHKRTVIVMNKTDLGAAVSADKAAKIFGNKDVVEMSVLSGTGLEKLEDTLSRKLFSGNVPSAESPAVTNLRHLDCLEKASAAARKALDMILAAQSAELIAIDLGDTAHYLGLITGKSIEDDVLDRIFSGFCIGK